MLKDGKYETTEIAPKYYTVKQANIVVVSTVA